MARIPIFLSAPKPFLSKQSEFLELVEAKLVDMGLEPRTLGRSDYDMSAPLEAIRRLMGTSCGLMAIAFRRTFIERGSVRPKSDIREIETSVDGTWLTSSYCQIEPAMAYQIGLPLLLWTEQGVLAEGVLDRGAIGLSMPQFDLAGALPSLDEREWTDPLKRWGHRVESVHMARGEPPRLWRD